MSLSEENSGESKTSLYVGNLDPRITELVLLELFAGVGPLLRVKLLGGDKPGNSSKYGFVEYADRKTAELALLAFNGKRVYNNDIKVNWAHGTNREEATHLHHIFIGDLSNEVSDALLCSAFSQFKSFSEARVMWDSVSGKSRGYGFASFKDKMDAEAAIACMNGKILGGRSIRTNWANHKSMVSASPSIPHSPQPTFQTISSQTFSTNSTVYVGNITPFTTQNQICSLFRSFGETTEVRLHADRGYAFVSFETHENAAMAIMCLNGVSLNGRNIKCSWGKEKSPSASSTSSNSPVLATQNNPNRTQSPISFNSSSSSFLFKQSPLDLFNLSSFPIKREFDILQKPSFSPFCRNF